MTRNFLVGRVMVGDWKLVGRTVVIKAASFAVGGFVVMVTSWVATRMGADVCVGGVLVDATVVVGLLV